MRTSFRGKDGYLFPVESSFATHVHDTDGHPFPAMRHALHAAGLPIPPAAETPLAFPQAGGWRYRRRIVN